jgi:hypothetical protein
MISWTFRVHKRRAIGKRAGKHDTKIMCSMYSREFDTSDLAPVHHVRSIIRSRTRYRARIVRGPGLRIRIVHMRCTG